MVEKLIKICDFCNDKVAKKTCTICNKDVCDRCGKDWRVLLNFNSKITLSFCKDCLEVKFSEESLEDISKVLIEKMKRGRIVNNLKDG